MLQDFEETKGHFQLPSPALAEKDWYVIRALTAIAQTDTKPFHLVFGGGTALCRAHRLFPAYRDNPLGETHRAIDTLRTNPIHQTRFAEFQRDMVYGPHIRFDDALATITELAKHLSDNHGGNEKTYSYEAKQAKTSKQNQNITDKQDNQKTHSVTNDPKSKNDPEMILLQKYASESTGIGPARIGDRKLMEPQWQPADETGMIRFSSPANTPESERKRRYILMQNPLYRPVVKAILISLWKDRDPTNYATWEASGRKPIPQDPVNQPSFNIENNGRSLI